MERIELPGTKHLPLGELKVDQAYQRELRTRFVEQIARNFDSVLFGALEVSERPDGYYVIDGQHRLAALHRMDWPGTVMVPCHVRRKMLPEREARHFTDFNTQRVRPSPYDLWRARRVAGDEKVMIIDSLLAHLDLKMVPSTSTADRGVRAIGTIEAIFTWHGPDMVERVLRIALDAWPNDLDGRSGVVLDAIASFIVTHAGRGVAVDDSCLTRACASRPAGQWAGTGTAGGVPAYKTLAAGLQVPYNRAARGARRVEELIPTSFSKRPRRGHQAVGQEAVQ